ncbi:PREDICTED: spindle and kinetochore-associated protein 1 [Nanorana parkeri]|uniref:spindle and kinetochore-associated protein 1 n=1 Tax=Nanorana parkeri TaxID=125878 RepID=UPI000854A7F6|nr:PREDICTED: spindle and kinetochore-associated protein 1 [Nanorana parkeri]
MDATELDDLCTHLNSKISIIKKKYEVRQDPPLRSTLNKVAYELHLLCQLLSTLETEVQYQESVANSLKYFFKCWIFMHFKEAAHLNGNIPVHLPKKGPSSSPAANEEAPVEKKVAAPEPVKKPIKDKHVIKEMELITVQEFETVPAYMKNRLTYEQINSLIEEVNKAVVGKYKIMQQPLKALNNVARKQLGRFKDEETKDTKGQFFIVEQDIKEFTQLKVDKRFLGMLNILRHCHRMRELRGKGIVRYVIC